MMKKQIITILLLGFVFVSCEKAIEPVEIFEIRKISFKDDLQPLFNQHCTTQGCHSYFEAAGKLDLAKYSYLDLTQEMSHEFPDMYRVVPYNLDSSVVIQKLEKNAAFGVGMPATLVGANISSIDLPAGDSTLIFLKGWIMQGAKDN